MTVVRWCERNILLPVTVCFMVGIFVGHALPPPIPERAAGIVLLLLATLALHLRRQPLTLFLSLPLFLLAGYVHVLHQLDLPKTAGQLAALIHEQTQVTLVGTLAGMAETGMVRTDEGEEIISRFELDAEEVRIEQHWQAVRGRVLLSVPGRADDLLPGATLMILAQIGPPHRFNTPGSFDYPAHLAAEDIFLKGWVSGRQDILPVTTQNKESGWRSLRFIVERTRQQVSLFLRQHLDPAVFGVYQALLIGSQAAVSPELREQFQATGTTHILSISGLHISLLSLLTAGLLYWFLGRSRWLLLHSHVPSLALLGTLPLLLAYALLAGLNTPVLRSLIMAAILLIAMLLRRQHSLLHLLAAAALFVLALNPLVLFTISFQLSFSAVAALILFLPKLLPPQTEQSSLLARFLVQPLLASLAATLGTLPLVLLHFNRFSIIGPLLNLLVEPLLCFWALPWGLAAIPCLFVYPQLAVMLLKIGSFGIAAGQWCVGQCAALPWASVWTISPNAAEIFVYFLLLLLLSLQFRKTTLLGAALLVLHFTRGLWLPEQPGSSTVAVLDVGQGLSAFLHLPDGTRILVDGGSSKSLNIGQQVIGPYLWSQRVWRLDQAVISHPHRDHFSGMAFILQHFHPKVLWINGDAHREADYQEIVDMAAQQGTAVLIPASGRRLAQGNDFALTMLGSFPGKDVNNAALVLRYQHGQQAFLLPGDIGKPSEERLLRQGTNVHADVLLAGHHGSSTSTGGAFLAAVQPQLIVVSAGEQHADQQHFPAPANLAAWRERNIPVLITGEQGGVTCVTDGERLNCTSRHVPSPGRVEP